MSGSTRYLLLLICAVQLFFAVAFFFQWPLAVNIWPFEGTTPLTAIFIGIGVLSLLRYYFLPLK